jgi:hypothetical protein
MLGSARLPSTTDVAVLRELQPSQRSSVFVVARDGSLRVLYGDDVPLPPVLPAPQLARAVATPSPRPALAIRLRPRPLVPHVAVQLPRLLAFAHEPFVPTLTVAKPVARPTPMRERDLAWLYAHRFDRSETVPGVPVRSQVASPFDIDSGAFHGVRATNGWSAIRVAVSIPCGARRFATGPGYNEVTAAPGIVDLETGYIYIGGWGAGPRGVSVDAGLQASSAQAQRDDYAFYWKFASNKPITSDERFPCGGPDVVLELYPVSPTQLVFTATGVTEDGTRRTMTVVQTTRADDGWSPDGGTASDGIILKRIVSIAQPWEWHRRGGGTRPDRFTSGSYFGVNGPHDLRPRIIWSRCELGHVTPPSIVPSYRTWTDDQTWTSRIPGIYTDWPPLGVHRSSDAPCDAAGLYLRA